MKKCLFFFVAFILAVALASLTETPVAKKAEGQAVVSNDQVAGQNPGNSDWPAGEQGEFSGSQTVNP